MHQFAAAKLEIIHMHDPLSQQIAFFPNLVEMPLAASRRGRRGAEAAWGYFLRLGALNGSNRGGFASLAYSYAIFNGKRHSQWEGGFSTISVNLFCKASKVRTRALFYKHNYEKTSQWIRK